MIFQTRIKTLGKGVPLYGRASHGVWVLLVWTLVRWDVLQVNSTCGVYSSFPPMLSMHFEVQT